MCILVAVYDNIVVRVILTPPSLSRVKPSLGIMCLVYYDLNYGDVCCVLASSAQGSESPRGPTAALL